MEDKFTCEHEGCGAEFDTKAQLTGHMMHHKRGRGEKSRKERIPLGSLRKKLSAREIPGKKTRWMNDNWRKYPTRIQDALDGGYGFVSRGGQIIGDGPVDGNTDLGSRVSKVVGSNSDGTPITSYLMAIDNDLYEEDQAEKQKGVNETDERIKKGTNKNTLGQYGYTAGIQYNPETPGR
uniref:C2H2-type domain-containing protein n=1 Tax=viral metagenome TaxID=1070528 RepID=A0A6M3JRF4_9ZZZZ